MAKRVAVADELIDSAMRSTGAESEEALMDAALRTLVELRRERGNALLDLWGRVQWEGDLEQSRLSREFE